MVKFNNFLGQNPNLNVIQKAGPFTVFEHLQDLSVHPGNARTKYFMAQMGCTPKQVLCTINGSCIKLKPGAMQFMTGNLQSDTGVKGIGDLGKKLVKGKTTGDNAIKPNYKGTGYLVTEPTFNYPIIVNLDEWYGAIVCDDGLFLACQDTVQDSVVMRSNVSSALLGGEGLFNLNLKGTGYAVINSKCPLTELYEIEITDDIIKIDGNNAICWSDTLNFTVEKSGKSLLGSAAGGEGLVNVYRGTGRILMAPQASGGTTASGTQHTAASAPGPVNAASAAGALLGAILD